MARRNRRRKQVHSLSFPVPFAGAMLVLSSLALVYVWLGCRCESLGREIKDIESKKSVLDKKYINEEYRWIKMKSLGNIEKTLSKYGIAMTWPRRDQVVRIYDDRSYSSSVARLERERERVRLSE